MTITGLDRRVDRIPLRVGVVVGSTREGRSGRAVADWFIGRAAERPELDLDVVDLADFDLPDRYPRRTPPDAAAFGASIARADGVVLVTPEYNHGCLASLKSAIDLACSEWHAKPVAFVSYGAQGHGVRAVEQLRQVVAALHAMPVTDALELNVFDSSLGATWAPRDPSAADVATKRLLDQLTWWARALRAARAEHPYVA